MLALCMKPILLNIFWEKLLSPMLYASRTPSVLAFSTAARTLYSNEDTCVLKINRYGQNLLNDHVDNHDSVLLLPSWPAMPWPLWEEREQRMKMSSTESTWRIWSLIDIFSLYYSCDKLFIMTWWQNRPNLYKSLTLSSVSECDLVLNIWQGNLEMHHIENKSTVLWIPDRCHLTKE